MILYKKDIFIRLKEFQVPIYANDMVHFKDVCIQLAHNAVRRKYRLDQKIEINDPIVLR